MSQFTHWVKTAKPGAQYIYYTGHLARDTGPGGYAGWATPTANEAWQAYEDLKVHLVQRKIKPGVYQYIAVKAE